MSSASRYQMSIELGVLDHLGLNLYSNIPAPLAEAVANAWDADATRVSIKIDTQKQQITIVDDGDGMNLADVNDKFLTVGYRRREDEPTITKLGRHVMGRKGIGKLSLFSIAEKIQVQTMKPAGKGKSARAEAFLLDTDEIRKSIEQGMDYHPKELDASKVKLKTGTGLILKDLKRKVTAGTASALRTRLARRFSIIGPTNEFEVLVDGEPIGVEDREYFKKVEYLWSIGDVGERYEKLATAATRKSKIDGNVKSVDKGDDWTVKGWIGTFDERKSIEPENNALTVLAWGKLVQEDLLAHLEEGGLYTKYLIGEIRADFLDVDNLADITTSDRQRIKETDPRYETLIEYVREKVLRPIGNNWRNWRREDGMKRALEEDPVKEWYDTLSPGAKKYAQTLFGRIGQMAKDDPGARRTLYRHGILAFERMRFHESLDAVERIEKKEDLELLSEFVTGFDDLEASYYHEIIRGRLEVIKHFEKVVDTEKEKVIQEHVFDHLWLLSPSWERASTNARIEQAVTKEFEKVDAGLSDEEKKGRIDIRYRTAANKNVIIELKKYDRKVTLGELQDQIQKYRNALEKVLAKFPDEPQDIEIIAILGQPVTNATQEQVTRALGALNARVIFYDQLIKETQDSYSDYLEKNEKLTKISEVLEKLEK